MSRTSPFIFAIIFVLAVIAQRLIPGIQLGGFNFKPDMFLIFLTYLAIHYNRFTGILAGFGFGLIQDFTPQVSLLGIYSFVKSISGYTIGTFHYYRTVWTAPIKLAVLFLCYIIHFLIYYYVTLNGSFFPFISMMLVVIAHSAINLLVVIILDRFIVDFHLK